MKCFLAGKYFRSKYCLLISVMTVNLLFAGITPAETIRMASNPWPPYYIDSQPVSGIMPEIITAAYAHQGKYRVSFHTRPWKRALFEVKEGMLDAITNAYYRPERAKHFIFSEACLSSRIMFYKLKQLPLPGWKDLSDLQDFRIGVEREHVYSPLFDSAGFLQKEEATTERLNFDKLLMGRVDLVPMDQRVARHYLSNHFASQADLITTVGPPLNSDSTIHLIFSKQVSNSQAMLDSFHSGLHKIRENGVFQQILNKYGVGHKETTIPEKKAGSKDPASVEDR